MQKEHELADQLLERASIGSTVSSPKSRLGQKTICCHKMHKIHL